VSSSTCRAERANVLDGRDNNGFSMVPLNDAGGVVTSSSARLAIPAGREIAFAGLYWSADTGPGEDFTGRLDTARLRAPGGGYAAVAASEAPELRTDDDGRTYYQSFADVTARVQSGGPGWWSVADVATASTRTDPVPTYYAGWALVVVYAEPGPTGGHVTVYDGASWIARGSTSTFAFGADAGDQSRVGVVAWEGDRGGTGDRLTLNGIELTPVRWTGTATTMAGLSGNAFDSTATGSTFANSLGVDAKSFIGRALANGVNRLSASTQGDQYLIGVVTVQATSGG
jgi:hypothetical protein